MSVVVVGSVNRDVVARVTRIPGPGETVLGTDLARTSGGKGANQAVAAARAGGAAVAFVGAVGDDPDGEVLRRNLADDGIDVSGLETVPGPSGTALISVSADAENAIVVVPGANGARDRLTPAQRRLVEGARVLVTQLEVPVELVLDAAAARADGALHVLNGAPSAPLVERADDVLPTVDVLIVNEHEALDITGASEIEEALAALSSRVPAVVVTLGAAGCLVVAAGERHRIEAFRARAVDTTGAGDTFCGMFAASLAAEAVDGADPWTLARAAEAGCAAAALAVRRPGAQEAVPARAEVSALLANPTRAADS